MRRIHLFKNKKSLQSISPKNLGESERGSQVQSATNLIDTPHPAPPRMRGGHARNLNNRVAFTLSEVLITLGVVGIVAVLTVPSVVRNYRNRLYAAQLQKISAQITDAAMALMVDENADNYQQTKASRAPKWKDDDSSKSENILEGAPYLLIKYLKNISTNCLKNNFDDRTACASKSASDYHNINSAQAITAGFHGQYCVQTVNGATVCINHNTDNKCTSLLVDINGKSEPNTVGRDIFSMDIHKDGTLSDWGSGCSDGNFGQDASKCGVKVADYDSLYDIAAGCYTRVAKHNWKMDY